MEHNYADELATLRDSFLSGEIDYLKELVKMPEFLEIFEKYRGSNLGVLSRRLTVLTEMMENGEVKEDEEAKVELDIMCCCLAIEDAIKTKGSLVKTPNQEELNGRSLH